MKLTIVGRLSLAIAASVGAILGTTSCSQTFTIGYMYVPAQQYSQIGAFKIANDSGNLTPIKTYSSYGINPVQAVVTPNGRFLYVLNNGCGGANQLACPSGTSGAQADSSINLFSIGGGGTLTFQQTYSSKGNNTISLAMNSAGSVMYMLDAQAPDGSNQGDISAFSVNPDTGYLSPILNQQVHDPTNGTAIPYFKVGSNPIWFSLSSSGSYLYTIEAGPGSTASTADPNQAVYIYQVNTTNGQLTLTQNAPTPTGATNLTYIAAGRGGTTTTNMFLLDAGPAGSNGFILPYTVGTSGALQSVVGGAVANNAQGGQAVNPVRVLADSTGKFLYVANAGPNISNNAGARFSSITGYSVNAGTQLVPISGSAANNAFFSGANPKCLVQDPSNQYFYTANFNDSSVTADVFNSSVGVLTPTRKKTTFAAPGNPTWCVVTGTTF